MILPFTHITNFILSYFGILAVTLLIYKGVEISIIALKKVNDQ